MAEVVGVIWRSPRGEREHIVRVKEITTAEDAKFQQIRFEGYSPQDKRKTQLLMGGNFNG